MIHDPSLGTLQYYSTFPKFILVYNVLLGSFSWIYGFSIHKKDFSNQENNARFEFSTLENLLNDIQHDYVTYQIGAFCADTTVSTEIAATADTSTTVIFILQN